MSRTVVARLGRAKTWAALGLALLMGAACGGDATGPGTNPDLVPFVGSWRATSMVVTSTANPEIQPDLIHLGAQFDLNVQPSGQYTAILTYQAQASTEIGFVTVAGNIVTMERTFPTPHTSTATYTLQNDVLTLVGDSEFDLNQDDIPEAVRAQFVLTRR